MISDRELDVLRLVMRENSMMSRWRRTSNSTSRKEAREFSNKCAMTAKTLYEAELERFSEINFPSSAKRAIATSCIYRATDIVSNRLGDAHCLARDSAANEAHPATGATAGRTKNRDRYNPDKVEVGARVDPPAYVRKFEEGIAGAREQVINERKKLSQDMLNRARGH